MTRPLVTKILTEIDNSIRHLTTPLLKADVMSSLLNVELVNCNNIDFRKVAEGGVKEMLDEMDKPNLVIELKFAINLVNHYIENNSLNLQTVQENRGNRELVVKFDEIKNQIFRILDKNSQDTVFL